MVHAAPAEIVDQLLKARMHRVEVQVVAKPGLERRAFDARLSRIDLPGVEVEKPGAPVNLIHALQAHLKTEYGRSLK